MSEYLDWLETQFGGVDVDVLPTTYYDQVGAVLERIGKLARPVALESDELDSDPHIVHKGKGSSGAQYSRELTFVPVFYEDGGVGYWPQITKTRGVEVDVYGMTGPEEVRFYPGGSQQPEGPESPDRRGEFLAELQYLEFMMVSDSLNCTVNDRPLPPAAS